MGTNMSPTEIIYKSILVIAAILIFGIIVLGLSSPLAVLYLFYVGPLSFEFAVVVLLVLIFYFSLIPSS